jgi:hypothetical protein
VLLLALARIITNLICEDRSLLLANEVLTKATSCMVCRLSLIKCSPCMALSSCHLRRLLSALISSFWGFVVCAANDKLNDALGCNTEAM